MSFLDATLRPLLRLHVLQALTDCAGYEAHEYHLSDLLDAVGLRVGADILHGELQWLAEQQLLTLGQVADAYIAHLTQRGRDVAQGRTHLDGIARPRPGTGRP